MDGRRGMRTLGLETACSTWLKERWRCGGRGGLNEEVWVEKSVEIAMAIMKYGEKWEGKSDYRGDTVGM